MPSVFPSGAPPARCGNGHELGPGRMIVGSVPCDCPPAVVANFRRHTWAKCNTCGHVTYDPEHGPAAGQFVVITWRRGKQVFAVGLVVACRKVVLAPPAAKEWVGRDVGEAVEFYRAQPEARIRWQRRRTQGG